MMTRSLAWADLAGEAFAAGLAAGHPHDVTMAAMATLDAPPSYVIAIGKASAAMAGAVRDAGCNAPGIVVTHDEGFAEIDGMRCFASAHPVPDARGMDAAAALGWIAQGIVASPITGPAGNHEYVLWLSGQPPAMALPDLGALVASTLG